MELWYIWFCMELGECICVSLTIRYVKLRIIKIMRRKISSSDHYDKLLDEYSDNILVLGNLRNEPS